MERRTFMKQLSAGIILPAICDPLSLSQTPPDESFAGKLLPAVKGGGFMMDDYWVWDPSVIKGEDGLYHMFASRWPKEIGFDKWVTNSQVVRAVADKPEGPYTFAEVVLEPRGRQWFDGLTTHNPRITRYKNEYLLFYMGNTYDFPVPDNNIDIWADGRAQKAWMNKRVGLAVAPRITGPWKRVEQPLIMPRPGKWDATITSNPSPVVRPDGTVYLMYKSSSKDLTPPLLLGAAMSKQGYRGPYQRLSEKPVFDFKSSAQKENDVEDPFVWWTGLRYELIMKDRFGHICGEEGGGIHASSKDGVNWKLSSPVKAYSRTIQWDDGTVTRQANFERPFLLFENGKPTHLFAATGSGNQPYQVDKTWNMVIPLKQDQ